MPFAYTLLNVKNPTAPESKTFFFYTESILRGDICKYILQSILCDLIYVLNNSMKKKCSTDSIIALKNNFLGHDTNLFDPRHLMYRKAEELPLFLPWLQNGIKTAFREL